MFESRIYNPCPEYSGGLFQDTKAIGNKNE